MRLNIHGSRVQVLIIKQIGTLNGCFRFVLGILLLRRNSPHLAMPAIVDILNNNLLVGLALDIEQVKVLLPIVLEE